MKWNEMKCPITIDLWLTWISGRLLCLPLSCLYFLNSLFDAIFLRNFKKKSLGHLNSCSSFAEQIVDIPRRDHDEIVLLTSYSRLCRSECLNSDNYNNLSTEIILLLIRTVCIQQLSRLALSSFITTLKRVFSFLSKKMMKFTRWYFLLVLKHQKPKQNHHHHQKMDKTGWCNIR